MDSKFKKVIDLFEESSIEIPEDVKNSIQDVFDENEEIDGVDVYLKNDIDEFIEDMSIKDIININISGMSDGKFTNTFTYYGENSYALSRKTFLIDGEEVDSVLEEFEIEKSFIDKNKWSVVLVEEIKFKNGIKEVILTLKIYCPEEETNEE